MGRFKLKQNSEALIIINSKYFGWLYILFDACSMQKEMLKRSNIFIVRNVKAPGNPPKECEGKLKWRH